MELNTDITTWLSSHYRSTMKGYGSIPRKPNHRDERRALLLASRPSFLSSSYFYVTAAGILLCLLASAGWFINTRSTTLILPASPVSVSGFPTSRITLLDEDSQPGDTLSSDSAPRSWLTNATKDWMSELPDSVSVASVSIPGTHDTAALFGGPACETQSWSLADQLNAGIRFFDIRCRRAGKVFAIHHGLCFQHLFFNEVLADMRDFLSAHPTEFIVMRVQEEYRPMEGSLPFTTIWSTYMKQFGYLLVDEQPTLPSVGALRGKILTMRPSFLRGKGILWEGPLTDTQDVYKVYFLPYDNPFGPDTASLWQKESLVTEYIDKAATSTKLVINFLSGANGMIPKDVARATNEQAYDYIGPYKGPKHIGVIIIDFPGERLVYRVIKTNFNSNVYCAPQTFRGQSDQTWVEFRMPKAIAGTVISINSGAYAIYLFPKCHRATWTDLRFECSSGGKWVLSHGSWDADAWCSSKNTNQPYLAVGKL